MDTAQLDILKHASILANYSCLRDHNWIHSAIGHIVLLLILWFKLCSLENLKLFSIRVKELLKPLILLRKSDGCLLFLKAFSWENYLWVMLVKVILCYKCKIRKGNLHLTKTKNWFDVRKGTKGGSFFFSFYFWKWPEFVLGAPFWKFLEKNRNRGINFTSCLGRQKPTIEEDEEEEKKNNHHHPQKTASNDTDMSKVGACKDLNTADV